MFKISRSNLCILEIQLSTLEFLFVNLKNHLKLTSELSSFQCSGNKICVRGECWAVWVNCYLLLVKLNQSCTDTVSTEESEVTHCLLITLCVVFSEIMNIRK